jgi:endonuclease IV
MADSLRFGPAGIPLMFNVLKHPIEDVPEYLHNEGLDAFEYQAVRWGPKPQMKKENAEKLGIKAKEHDVRLSVHGSYFVNFCGDTLTVEASKRRLVTDAAKEMHCHYTRVEFGRVGEKRYHTMDETKYGLDFEPLAILIAELGLDPVILSESPILDIDSQKMQDIVFREINKRNK